ncbi:MAG: Uma2 family endonuclease [Spirulinaceae cyanobacterium]
MVQTPIKPELNTQYPDSDGKPMADNTQQYQWIVRIVENLKLLLEDQTAFVAGDLLWYPVQVGKGETAPRQAPDAMVVLGRPDGHRGSYQQWKEDGVAPQVVFEIISPSNSLQEMADKQAFYAQHGVLEMYFYDPDSLNFWGLVRESPDHNPRFIFPLDLPWASPMLGIQFKLFEDGLEVFYANGEPFKTFSQLNQERNEAKAERDEAKAERDDARTQLNQTAAELGQAETERDRAFAKLRELGIDPANLN